MRLPDDYIWRLMDQAARNAAHCDKLITDISRDRPELEADLRQLEEIATRMTLSIIYQYGTR